MTARLYYDDCYLTACDATVVDRSEDRRRVYLDRTAFYPASGGQPDDRGSINGIPVTAVEDEEAGIAHVLAAPLTETQAHCNIDWPRRYDHMQQHTGQHLLSAVAQELYGFRTLSFHMGVESSNIELESGELTLERIAAIEDRVNELARAALPVSIGYESADAASNLRKASSRSGELRIIRIEGVDRSACGGTHVRSTAEVAPIQIRRQEKIRGNTRIEFVCGVRALHRMRRDYRIMSEMAREANWAADDLPAHLAQLRIRLAEAAKDRSKLVTELARLQGEELYRQTAPAPDGLRKAVARVPTIDDAVRARLEAFAAMGKAAALAFGENPPGALIRCSADSGIDAGALLKQTLAKFGGRGGGSVTSAQGNLPCAEAAAELAKALGLAIEL